VVQGGARGCKAGWGCLCHTVKYRRTSADSRIVTHLEIMCETRAFSDCSAGILCHARACNIPQSPVPPSPLPLSPLPLSPLPLSLVPLSLVPLSAGL
jgi:hypothetical protein